APLFVRQGRGLVLTARGARLLEGARPHLEALEAIALAPARFDPKQTERTIRIGISDENESWLLPPLLAMLEREAPRMRVVVVPVTFRNVGQGLATGALDCALTVADDLPTNIQRKPLFKGGFVCLYDPRHAKVKKTLTKATYLEHRHVIVS